MRGKVIKMGLGILEDMKLKSFDIKCTDGITRTVWYFGDKDETGNVFD